MTLVAWLVLGLLVVDADAKDRPSKREKALKEPAELTVAVDAPAAEPGADGLWDWIERLEGEVPTHEAQEALEEQEAVEAAERPLVDDLGGADVPLDFYTDPVGALSTDPLQLDRIDASEFDIPITVNASVEKWVRYFTGPGRKYFHRWLTRSTAYRPLMYAELEKRGLPRDLVYLSMIESGYNAHAYSHADAAGLWQFIPSTGRIYDLRQDWWIDDRRDPVRSTHAALDFLTDLHKMFDGNWYLAFAAYNGGPGRVRRAVNDAGSTDFWRLAEGDYLHSETDNYVPKILAAAIIGKHPERYGFTDVAYEPEFTGDLARVDGSVELEVLARAAGITLEELQHMNPALRRWATPPEGYELRVPPGKGRDFLVALAAIPASERLTFVNHTVKRGETLSVIAAKYGVTSDDVARANRLANVDRIYVGMSLVIPQGGSRDAAEGLAALTAAAPATPAPNAPAPAAKAPAAPAPATYTVKSGDTLSEVAARHGVTTAQLQAWNGLRSSTIYVGQRLELKGGAAPAQSHVVKHTVKSGETLSGIAAKYGVRTAELQEWNGVRDPSHIQVGQALTVRVPDSAWKSYTVRAGDSLGAIATRNGCSVDELRSWNGLASTVIHPGQELRIKN